MKKIIFIIVIIFGDIPMETWQRCFFFNNHLLRSCGQRKPSGNRQHFPTGA